MAIDIVTNNPTGRPSNARLTERLERSRLRGVILADEVNALHAERAATGVEVEALSRRLQIAFWNERPDVALHVAGRLEALARSLQRRGTAA